MKQLAQDMPSITGEQRANRLYMFHYIIFIRQLSRRLCQQSRLPAFPSHTFWSHRP
jgi:hypothetical protein